MTIKEEPVRIEFQYEREGTDNGEGCFKIEYFSEKDGEEEKKYLRVIPQGSDIAHTFEVNFFVEVVDFLRKKGVIGEEIEAEIPEGLIPRSGLPLPSIQMATGNVDASQSAPPLPVIEAAGQIPIPVSIPASTLIPPRTQGAPKVISAEANVDMPVINRPVIRTRVAENEDPMKGILESKRQRQVNPQKSIKRKEEAEEIDNEV